MHILTKDDLLYMTILNYIQTQMENKDYSILNLDYNNIQDRKVLQNIALQSRAIVDNLIKQINQLNNVRDKQAEERQLIINKMQNNKLNNQNKISYFKNQIFVINQDFQKFIKESDDDRQKQKKNIQSQNTLQMIDLSKKIEQLQNQYKILKQFQQKESNYLSKIQQLKKQLISKQYQHHDNMNKQEIQQMKQNAELSAEKSLDMFQTKKNAHQEALKKISYEIQTNQQANSRLKSQLSLLQTDLSKLKKERNQILNRRKQLKINISINEEELQEYKAVGSLQKAKIKAYKDKADNLKLMINQQVGKKQKIINDLKRQRDIKIKTLRLKLFNLQKQKQDLKFNIQKMKLLGQTIILQRNQVEQFFQMAIEAAKRQVQQQEMHTLKMEKKEKHYGEKVDIQQLLPKDKLRIITNLYTKLALGPN